MAAKTFPRYIYLGFLAPARKCMNNMRKKNLKVLTKNFYNSVSCLEVAREKLSSLQATK